MSMFATHRITGRMYARVFTALLFRVESIHISYDRISANPLTKTMRNIKKPKTIRNRFIKGEELCGK